MFCGKCGTEIKENWKVCPNCGEKMETLKEEEFIFAHCIWYHVQDRRCVL